MNVEIVERGPNIKARYHSSNVEEARANGATFIHWLPEGEGIEASVIMPDASSAKGIAETSCMDLKVDEMIQFERFGFVRVDSKSPFSAYYAHR